MDTFGEAVAGGRERRKANATDNTIRTTQPVEIERSTRLRGTGDFLRVWNRSDSYCSTQKRYDAEDEAPNRYPSTRSSRG
jgi:hypothetical protein